MKTSEMISIALPVILAAALLYRKYGKGNKRRDSIEQGMPPKQGFNVRSSDDDYEPYSNKRDNT
jgi:hypothetical protein